MTSETPEKPAGGHVESAGAGTVTVRYWAAAKAAAGVDSDVLAVTQDTTLAAVLATVFAIHADSPKFYDVIGVCSVLVGDRPMGGFAAEDVVIRPGDSVELLPPFAGG